MKSYSFFTIILLCIVILIVDIFAFYWLQTITQFIISDILRDIIYILFWTFTLGLITAILIIKLRLDNKTYFCNYNFNITFHKLFTF